MESAQENSIDKMKIATAAAEEAGLMSTAAKNLSARSSKTYKIGELARLTGSTTRTLRYYEELNLLQPIRNTSGQRLYSEGAIQRLNFINELKSGGFSLNEIKAFFDTWQDSQTGAEASEATVNVVENKMAEIAELQKKLGKLHDELRGMISFLVTCKHCEEKPSADTCGTCEKHPEGEPASKILSILKKERA